MSRELLKEFYSWWTIKDTENVVLHDVSAKEIIDWLRKVNEELEKREPAKKKPLSEEQAGDIFCNQCKSDDWLDLVRAIEKAHGIE